MAALTTLQFTYTGKLPNTEQMIQQLSSLNSTPKSPIITGNILDTSIPLGDTLASPNTFAQQPQPLIAQLNAHQGTIQHLDMNKEGTRLLSTDQEGNIYLWNTRTWKEVAHWKAGKNAQAWFNEQSNQIITQSGDAQHMKITLRNASNGQTSRMVMDTALYGKAKNFYANHSRGFVTTKRYTSDDTTDISIWDAENGTQVLDNTPQHGVLNGVMYLKNTEQLFISQSESGAIYSLWTGDKLFQSTQLSSSENNQPAYHAETNRLALFDEQAHKVRIWNLNNFELIDELPQENAVNLSWNKDASQLFIYGDNRNALQKSEHKESEPQALRNVWQDPNSKHFYGITGNTIAIWDGQQNIQAQWSNNHDTALTSAQLANNQQWLATADKNGIQVWKTQNSSTAEEAINAQQSLNRYTQTWNYPSSTNISNTINLSQAIH